MSGLFNNFYYGKAGKADFTPEQLPKNRVQLFFSMLRVRLSGLIGLGGLFAGLLSNAGIGLLVLLRTNKNLKENLVITSTLYGLSAAAGIVITLVSGLL